MYFYCKSLCILIVVYVFLSLSMYSYCCLCILIVRPCILNVVYVFLSLSMYSYFSSMYSYRFLRILIVVHVFLESANLTEVFPCFFLGCKANARVQLAKTGHGPPSSNCFVVLYTVCFVSLYVLFVCKCVLYFCQCVTTQLQLTYISYIRTHSVPLFELAGLLFHAHHSILPHSVFLEQLSAFRFTAFRDCTANSATESDALAGSGRKGA